MASLGTVPAGTALARSAAFAGLFTAAMFLGRASIMDGAINLVWPAAGVASLWFAVQRRAATLVLDTALLAGLSVVVDLATGLGPVMTLAFVAANLAQLAVFHTLMSRWLPQMWGAGGDEPLSGVRELSRLLAAAVAASGVGACIGPVAERLVDGDAPALASAVWVARNSAAITLLMTLGLRLGSAFGAGSARRLPMRTLTRWAWAELALLTAVSAGVYVAVFGYTRLPLPFVTIAVTVWIALRFDTALVVLHSLLAAGTSVVLTLDGRGPYAAIENADSRALVLQTFIALITVIGLTLSLSRDERELLLHDLRTAASLSAAQAERMAVLAETSRALAAAEDARTAICHGALRVAGADGAYLLEADGRGYLVLSASAGVEVPDFEIDTRSETSQAGTVMITQELSFVSDLESLPVISRRVQRLLGARSAAWQPVVAAGGRSVGVISLVFRRPVPELDPHVPQMLGTLAGEAAAAIERADLLDQLARAADRDPLTDIANRRRWDETAAVEIARAQRTGHPLSVVLADLDHFKDYNDRHGHIAGDELLRDFAAAATECLRDVDTIARWGGEEFAIALPDCTAADALLVADRIRAAVPRGATCTLGIAEWAPGMSATTLLSRADTSLYRGKKAGRNVAVVFTESPAAV